MTATRGPDGPTAAGTLAAAVDAATQKLKQAGIEQPRLDARLLVAHALGVAAQEISLRPERTLSASEQAAIDALIARRANHEPVSRILGAREFWSLDFALSPATLDPRPDSETLVEAVLADIRDRQARLHLLDLGTGTGCLLLALLSELPNATGIGGDVSPAAVATAQANAAALNLSSRASFIATHWADGIAGPFDIVVSNPPYIPSRDIESLAPEVARFDPRAALDGGADGLDAYRVLAERIPELLVPGGLAALEIGAGQADDVATILHCGGLAIARRATDLNGHTRCLIARRQ